MIGNPLTGNQNAVRRSVSAAPLSSASGSSFYLDTNNSATCSGTVTSWRYCYFPPQSEQDVDALPSVQFAVYRLNATSNSYVRVSRVYTAFGVDDIDSTIDCRSLQLRRNQFTQVQAGDVIGACIYQPSSNAKPLNVVGRGVSGQQALMQGGACSFNSLPQSTTQPGLTAVDGLVLLVFADQIIEAVSRT